MALPSAGARFYYHHLDMSPYVDGVDPTLTRDLAEHRPLGDNPVRLSAGHMRSAVALTGVYDAAAGGEEETVWAAFGGGEARPFAHLPEGDGLSKVAYCGLSDIQSEQITAGEGFVKFPVAVVGSSQIDRCRVLAPLSQREASGEEPALDDGAATTSGAGAYLLCTQIDPGAALAVTVEHSSDGLAWESAIAFSQLTATGSAVEEVTGEVRRYSRARWVLTGGHATFFVALGRR